MKPKPIHITPAELERREWRNNMWTRIGAAVLAGKPTFRLQKPQGEYWSSISIGRSGFHLSMLLNARNKNIAVELYISTDWTDAAFQTLYEQKNEIEAVLGPLDWQPLEGKKSARIMLVGDIDPKDESKHEKVDAWFADNVQRFYDVFKDRVARLEAP